MRQSTDDGGARLSERRKPTSTSSFGVGRRENHDASSFYERFTPPELALDDNDIHPEKAIDRVFCSDAREMIEVPDNSVALVVTSPPYFAGKEYEEALGEGHIPATYLEYLTMLEEVFAECVRTLEPGGRIAVNVANLGRRPYRSLSADVIRILQDRLKLLLRGEVIWWKARGAGGSCAWGSFQSAANPVLRDLTERVVIASKGRFDRALSRRKRATLDLPSEGSIFRDDFMEATTDLWADIPPESATRVGHPAPFPVELPLRFIDLYTYRDDLVLDPFMGSGSTAVAAVRSDRHYVGYDTDEEYRRHAEERVEAERALLAATREQREARRVVLPAIPATADENEPFQARAVREGQKAREIARAVLTDCGFDDFKDDVRLRSGVEVNLTARDRRGQLWYFDISGAFTTSRAGLRRTDTLWKALGKAAVLRAELGTLPRLILLSTDLPQKGSAGWAALCKSRGDVYIDAIEMLSAEGQERLRRYAAGEGVGAPLGELIPPALVDDH
jgi:DNA modification methylase